MAHFPTPFIGCCQCRDRRLLGACGHVCKSEKLMNTTNTHSNQAHIAVNSIDCNRVFLSSTGEDPVGTQKCLFSHMSTQASVMDSGQWRPEEPLCRPKRNPTQPKTKPLCVPLSRVPNLMTLGGPKQDWNKIAMNKLCPGFIG